MSSRLDAAALSRLRRPTTASSVASAAPSTTSSLKPPTSTVRITTTGTQGSALPTKHSGLSVRSTNVASTNTNLASAQIKAPTSQLKKPITTTITNENQFAKPLFEKKILDTTKMSHTDLKRNYELLHGQNGLLARQVAEMEKEKQALLVQKQVEHEQAQTQIRLKDAEIEALRQQIQLERQNSQNADQEWNIKFEKFKDAREKDFREIVETQAAEHERLETDLAQAKDRLAKADRKLEELGIDPETLLPFGVDETEEEKQRRAEENRRLEANIFEMLDTLEVKFGVMQRVAHEAEETKKQMEEDLSRHSFAEDLEEFESLVNQYPMLADVPRAKATRDSLVQTPSVGISSDELFIFSESPNVEFGAAIQAQ